MQALSQLSYSPKSLDHLIEVVVGRHPDPEPLVVTGGRKAQVEIRLTGKLFDRQQEAAVELVAVDADRVDLVQAIRRSDVAGRRQPGRSRPDHDDGVAQRTPLALDAKQPVLN